MVSSFYMVSQCPTLKVGGGPLHLVLVLGDELNVGSLLPLSVPCYIIVGCESPAGDLQRCLGGTVHLLHHHGCRAVLVVQGWVVVEV